MALINFLSQEEIRNKILNKWREQIPNIATDPDSQVYMDADAIAETIFSVQVDAFSLAEESFIAFATGDRLSNLGIERGIPRREATNSSGEVTFSRAVKAETDFVIPLGTEVSTQPSVEGITQNFKTTQPSKIVGKLQTPSNLQVTTQPTGGLLSDSTEFFYVITAKDALGIETDSSNEVSVLTSVSGGTNSNTLTWDFVPNASEYIIYVSNTSGTQTKLTSTVEVFFTHTFGDGDGVHTPNVENNTGTTFVTVPVQAIEATGDSNVPSGTITKLVDEPVGIEQVTNAFPTAGGTDEESDLVYRERMQLAFIYGTAQSKTTARGYEQTALSVPGVKTARYYNPNSGIDRNLGYLYITSTETDSGIPSTVLIAVVQETIDDDDNRSPNDYIQVLAPTPVPINITIELLEIDINYDDVSVRDSVEENVKNYLLGLGVGENVLRVGLNNAIHDTPGVIDFDLNLPATNVTISDTQKAIHGTINIILP